MKRIGHWDNDDLSTQGGNTYSDVWGYSDSSGREYAIIGHVDSIFIFDVTETPSIKKVFSVLGGSRSIWRDFKTYGDRLYAISDNSSEGLLVVDLSPLPDSAILVSRLTGDFESAHNIFIDSSTAKLYVAGSNTVNKGLIIYDLNQNPDTPSLIKLLDFRVVLNDFSTNYYVHDLFVRNDTAYCSHGYTGYFIWELTNPDSAMLLGNYAPPGAGYNHSSWITPDAHYAVYAEEIPRGRPLTFVDISDLPSIIEISNFKMPLLSPDHINNVPHNPYILGDKVYTSYYEDGVIVVDISDPSNPNLSAFYDTNPQNTIYNGYENCWGVYPYLPSGKILASDIENGLFVLELDESIEVEFYMDSDGDGYGDPGNSTFLADTIPPEGFVINSWDCDDTNADINPAVEEICDYIDNNCDSLVDSECDDCDYLEEHLVLDENPIPGGNYDAIISISSSGTVGAGSTVGFYAGTRVILNPGFEVQSGAIFEVLLEACEDE